ncbi:tetraspanin 6 isoform X2 [Ptiloglossa arizonensis]|uniref:tetraspanin 6 isoform X2 n=1 Tax=Ptiloglossa arizonensis TaxID=3350558 RepID=UPI003F9F8329
MSCVSECIKWLLFVFNFLFAVCGLAILAISIVAHLQLKSVTEGINTNIVFPVITLMVIGSIIFVISFFGCCGAIRESHCMTITFASFLLFLLLIQVSVAVYAFVAVVKNDNTQIDIVGGYRKIFDQYYTQSEDRILVDEIQNALHCCGVDSPKDFTGTIPASCCGKLGNETCSAGTEYSNGCGKEILRALEYAGSVLGGVAIGIAVVELIGIVFALCLANSIKNAERRGYRV